MSKELLLHHQENFTPAGLQLELQGFVNHSKEQIIHAAQIAAQSVQDGECDAIDALIFTKKGAELFKEMDARIRPIAESKSLGKEYSKFGVKIVEAMTGVKYDFSSCSDVVWNELNAEIERLKDKIKERETFLKSVTKKMIIVDEDTGDIIEIHPPVKSGKLGFTLTVK